MALSKQSESVAWCIVLLFIVFGLVVSVAFCYLLLLAVQFLFNWPQEITIWHTFATWVVIFSVRGMFK